MSFEAFEDIRRLVKALEEKEILSDKHKLEQLESIKQRLDKIKNKEKSDVPAKLFK